MHNRMGTFGIVEAARMTAAARKRVLLIAASTLAARKLAPPV